MQLGRHHPRTTTRTDLPNDSEIYRPGASWVGTLLLFGARIRVAEVFAALSLTTDLASGVPFEKGLQTCVVA